MFVEDHTSTVYMIAISFGKWRRDELVHGKVILIT